MRYRKKENDRPMMAEEPDLGGSYTAADYIRWTFEGLVELVEGKIYKMSPAPAPNHQVVAGNLYRVVGNLFYDHPCRCFLAPFDVYLVSPGQDFKEAVNVFQPDMCIICDESKISARGFVGAPDWVAEILSPSNSSKDVRLKVPVYERFGVRELWIISYQDKTVIPNVLNAKGKYDVKPVCAPPGQVESAIFPELMVDMDELFRRML